MAIYANTELKIDDLVVGGGTGIVNGFVLPDSPFADYALCEFSLEAGLLRPTVFRFKIRKKKLGRDENKIKLKDPITDHILGQKISCKVTTNEHAGDLEFEGTVLEAEADKLYITGTAYSADYVLNDAPCCKSYLDKSLKEVICDTIGQRLALPVTDGTGILKKKIGYIVRYNETSYQFLTRLARQYGLYFLIKNNVLWVFQGKPISEPIDMELRTDSGYTGFTYKLKTKFPKPAYMVLDDNECKNWHEWNILDGGDINAEAMVKRVNNLSKSFFSINDNDPPKLYYDYSVYHNQKIDTEGVNGCFESDERWLDSMVQRHTSSLRSQYVECTLTTHRANLIVGDTIVIKEKIIENNIPATKEHEKLMVVGLKYTWDATGNFVGKVTAIPDVCTAPPYFDPEAYPKSGVQRAKVVDNKDVKKMGRVKVQFVWQGAWLPANSAVTFAQGNNESPWIPVAHPYASSSGTGCFVIPEIGDEVLVGFEHDNVEKPYVIGVLYHGVEGENANKKDYKPDDKWADYTAENKGVNVVKALRTRSGQTIEIHDDNSKDENNKKGFVRIYTNPLAQNNGGANNNNGNNNGNAAPREYDIVLSKDDWRKANDIDKALKAADAEKVKIGVASDGSIVISCAENLVLKAKNIKIIADETFDMSVAGKTGGRWNDDQNWKDTEFGTKMAIAKDKMEILAVGKDTKMKVSPVEQGKAAQTFSLTVGKSFIAVNGTKEKEEIDLQANNNSSIIVDGTKGDEGIGLQANKSSIVVDGKNGAEKIDVKANESFVAVDGKNGAEKINAKAKGSYVTVDGKNGAERIDVTANDSYVTVDGTENKERIFINASSSYIMVNGTKDVENIEVWALKSSISVDGTKGAEKIDVKAKESSVTVDGNGKAIVIKTDGSVALKDEEGLTIDGGTDLKINATKAAVETKATLDIKGKTVTVDGGPLLQLKGASIKNN